MIRPRLKLSIATKSLVYYLSILIFALVIVVSTYVKYSTIQQQNRKIVQVYLRGLRNLTELKLTVSQSNTELTKWFLLERDTASYSYKQIKKIHRDIYTYKQNMWPIVDNWRKTQINQYYKILALVDTLFTHQEIVLSAFERPKNFENYALVFETYNSLLPGGDFSELERSITDKINLLSNNLDKELSDYIAQNTYTLKRYQRSLVVTSIIFLLILTILSFIYTNETVRNTNHIIRHLEDLVKGKIPKYKPLRSGQEFGRIQNLLTELSNGLEKASSFALKLAENNFNVDFKPLSNEDILGNALLKLRDNLIKAQHEAELRRIENYQRQWSSQGIAEFSELLREHADNLDELARSVIAKLVDYTVADIGGLYIVNDEDPDNITIELKAFYAFDRHKFLKRTFKPGETLVGQCYLEGETIYMNDIPEDYIKITSGLGSDKPRSLLIVPLKVNEQILGIVELASFKEFEQYQIEFVEKIGESIASAISTVKINIRTRKLLEETAEKTKRLEIQENIARQNIAKIEAQLKELKKTLERERAQLKKVMEERNKLETELKRVKYEYEEQIKQKQIELDNLLMAINNTLGYYQLNASGDFIDANTLYLKFLNVTKDQIIGTKHQRFISREFISSGNYKKIWDDLKAGKTVSTTVQYLVEGKIRLISEVYTPVLNEENLLDKVIVLSYIG